MPKFKIGHKVKIKDKFIPHVKEILLRGYGGNIIEDDTYMDTEMAEVVIKCGNILKIYERGNTGYIVREHRNAIWDERWLELVEEENKIEHEQHVPIGINDLCDYITHLHGLDIALKQRDFETAKKCYEVITAHQRQEEDLPF